MLRKLTFGLPCLLLAACADTSEKYRDTHLLELPPTLAIEHHGAVDEAGDAVPEAVNKPLAKKKSVLEGIEELAEKDGKPILIIKTRLDRAWDLTETALKLANAEILDRNRNELTFQVNYDPDDDSFLNLLTNQYEAAHYTVTVKEAILGIEVGARLTQKAANGEETQEGDIDGSAELIKRLHQVLQEKIINRENKNNGDS